MGMGLDLTNHPAKSLLDRLVGVARQGEVSDNALVMTFSADALHRLEEHDRARNAFSPATNSEGDPIIT